MFNGFDLSTIQDAKFGNSQVSSIYYGANLIWPTTPPPHDYSLDYFTIEITSSMTGHKLELYWYTNDTNYALTIDYSTDNGSTWTSITASSRTTGSSIGNFIGRFNTGDKVLFRGNNSKYSDGTWINQFTVDGVGSLDVYGNIMSLIYGNNFIGTDTLTDTYVFYEFFYNLPIDNSINLVLPATTLTDYCYARMFMYWTVNNLQTTIQKLPATTLADHCYYQMFSRCDSIITGPDILATNLTNFCCFQMFNQCISLTTAPILRATNLASMCYSNMFWGCSSLNYVKCYAADLSPFQCINNWMYNVSSTGTFYKDANTTWPSGDSGIPSGWTVINI